MSSESPNPTTSPSSDSTPWHNLAGDQALTRLDAGAWRAATGRYT